MKIAILSSFTLDPIRKYLSEVLSQNNIENEFYISWYNQYNQEIINESSKLYEVNPDIIILSIDINDIINDNIFMAEKKDIKAKKYIELYNNIKERIKKIINKFPDTLILFNNFYYPPINNNSLLNYNSEYDNITIINHLNTKLYKDFLEHYNFNIVDLNSLLMNYGYNNLFDLRMWYIGKIHLSDEGLNKLSELYKKHIFAYIGKNKKCIVLDLDNTLWGGIIGEDGIDSIILSNDGIGKSFYDFQKTLLGLYKKGIILSICSKNTYDIAMDAIKNHPYMLLKEKHFASIKINWNDKATNIKRIANELNIGLDSILFLDDSEHERELVRKELPQVAVPDMPEDYIYYSSFLMNSDYFNFINLTNTDKKRNKMYKDDQKREKVHKESTDLKDYYYSLNMKVYIDNVDKISMSRVIQLIQRTNQFNLTTKRYKYSKIQKFIDSDNYSIYYIKLKDKFGELGIIGTAIIKYINDKKAYIDTFILSCRAMGRTVETAFLGYLLKLLKIKNYQIVLGEYIETKKNTPVKDFYKKHNFKKKKNNIWELSLKKNSLNIPKWIKVINEEENYGK